MKTTKEIKIKNIYKELLYILFNKDEFLVLKRVYKKNYEEEYYEISK